jgi:hypothetical protein
MRSIEQNLHPDEPWFTLRGKDLLAPYTVQSYANLCRVAAAGLRHGDSVFTGPDKAKHDELIAQAEEAEQAATDMMVFQAQHPELAKLPD